VLSFVITVMLAKKVLLSGVCPRGCLSVRTNNETTEQQSINLGRSLCHGKPETLLDLGDMQWLCQLWGTGARAAPRLPAISCLVHFEVNLTANYIVYSAR